MKINRHYMAKLFLLIALLPVCQIGFADSASQSQTLLNTRNYLLSKQKSGSYWSEPLVMSVTNDAISLVLAKHLGKLRADFREDVLATLAKRMEYPEGWTNYPGGPLNDDVSAITLICLQEIGVDKSDPRFAAAFAHFEKNGGVNGISVYASFMLSPLGLVPKLQALPSTPKILGKPAMLKDLGSMLDGYLVPYAAYAFLKTVNDGALFKDRKSADDWRALGVNSAATDIKVFKADDSSTATPQGMLSRDVLRVGDFFIDFSTAGSKSYWSEQALARTLKRQNTNSGWYGMYFSTVALELLSQAERVGLGDFSKEIDQGWQALLVMRARSVDGLMVQSGINTGNWDTSSIFNAFQALEGTPLQLDDTAQAATTEWFLSTGVQDSEQNTMAWGFDETDKWVPDVDTTANVTEALALSPFHYEPDVEQAIQGGTKWILDHQNKDGGFPVWQKDGGDSMVSFVANMLFKDFAINDVSQSDITGRVLHAFQILEPLAGPYQERMSAARIAACKYLSDLPEVKNLPVHLQPGNWMTDYTYSAANLLIGLAAAGCNHEQAVALVNWLESIQSADGGWGESFDSYKQETYVPGKETLSQTGMALMGLITYTEDEIQGGRLPPAALVQSINKGLDFLAERSGNGTTAFETDFTFVVMKSVYARYELAPAYIMLYTLGHWQKVLASLPAQLELKLEPLP